MTYSTVAAFTQSLALVLFLLVFLGSVVYAVWPGNKEKFKHAANLPLVPDPELDGTAGASLKADQAMTRQRAGDRDGRA